MYILVDNINSYFINYFSTERNVLVRGVAVDRLYKYNAYP